MNDCYLNFLVSFRALFSLDVGANLVNSKQTIGIILPDLSLLGYAVPVESFGIGLFVILFAYLIIEYNVQLLSHEKFKIAMNMLHTAHTPLILLRNQLEELKTGNLPEPLSQQVEEALGYAECIIYCNRNIATLNKVNKRIPPKTSTVNLELSTYVTSIVNQCRAHANSRQIRLTVGECSDCVSCRINENIMTAALQHLINKMILISESGCCISINVTHTMNSWQLQISNNEIAGQRAGKMFPFIPIIFPVYGYSDLWTVRKIIRLHGGKITGCRHGKAATFQIVIPTDCHCQNQSCPVLKHSSAKTKTQIDDSCESPKSDKQNTKARETSHILLVMADKLFSDYLKKTLSRYFQISVLDNPELLITLLEIIAGMPVADFKNMWNTVWGLRGTPQNTVDWTNPDEWIDKRLSGRDREIANKIWQESNKTVNPRWTRGCQFLISGYNLISESDGIYQLTEDGKVFISSLTNEVVRRIDIEEGVIQVLRQLSLIGNGKRADLLDEWKEFIKYNSNIKQDSVCKDYLRRRLVNLLDRKYVKREGNTYYITNKGLDYLQFVEQSNPDSTINKETQLIKTVESFNKEQRHLLKKYLEETTPYRFENIIKDLLVAMGYDDVTVTTPTNDKGVDVTGISQNGITTVKEVIQVKRNITSNVTRPILDALRGSLHRFDAFQGTIITLSDFAKGAKEAAIEKGAAPLTLINGDKLIDLLIKNNIGITPKIANYYLVDEKYFEEEENVD